MYVAQVYLETSVEYIFDICFFDVSSSFDSSHYMCGHMCTTTVTRLLLLLLLPYRSTTVVPHYTHTTHYLFSIAEHEHVLRNCESIAIANLLPMALSQSF